LLLGVGLRGRSLGEKQKQVLRLTTPKLKKTLGAPFAQDDTALFWMEMGREL
jgi:hypothetical protein